MNSYAVVKLGSSQHKVSIGDLVVTDKMDNNVGDKITVNDVYMLVDGDEFKVGTPTVGVAVELEVVSHGKGEKIKIHKFKAKSRYHKTTGFRAKLTTLKVLSIGDKKAEKVAKSETTEKVVAPKAKPAVKKVTKAAKK
ncbi:MAG: 50S ribosomal protein L21 [bacterium]